MFYVTYLAFQYLPQAVFNKKRTNSIFKKQDFKKNLFDLDGWPICGLSLKPNFFLNSKFRSFRWKGVDETVQR